jgi:hypothetical protein
MTEPPKGFSSQTSYTSTLIVIQIIVILFFGVLAIQLVSATSGVKVDRCSQEFQKQLVKPH